MEVAGVACEHLGDEGEFGGPERSGCGNREEGGGGVEEPESVVPDPVAFWVEELEGEDELEVQVDNIEDLGGAFFGGQSVG